MSYSDNKEQWFRDMIMDHYRTPRNKGLVDDTQNYIKVHLKNPSCGDDLIIQVNINEHQIEDIRYEGSGCAICCASASMLTENVNHQSVEHAKAYITAFSNMVSGDLDIDETILQDAIALQGVAKLPPRIKCATLGCKALEKAITGEAIADNEIEEN